MEAYLVVDGKVLYETGGEFLEIDINLSEYYITAFFTEHVGPKIEYPDQMKEGYMFLTKEKDLYSIVYDEGNIIITKLFSNIAYVGSKYRYIVCVDNNGKIVTDDDEFPGNPENVFFIKAFEVNGTKFRNDRGIVAIDNEGNLWVWGNNNRSYLGYTQPRFFEDLTKITENYKFIDILPVYKSTVLLDNEGKLYMFGTFGDLYPMFDETLNFRSLPLTEIKFPEKISKIFFDEALIIYTENGNLYSNPKYAVWMKSIVDSNDYVGNYFGNFFGLPINFIPQAFFTKYTPDGIFVTYIRDKNRNLYKINSDSNVPIEFPLKVNGLTNENFPLISSRFYSTKSARK